MKIGGLPERGVEYFYASLANIFNKCKKAVFYEKQLNLGIYKI